ncbi:MAG: DNA polymerase I [Armatimonadota bacterium]|nr:DNA polymerase I [Armatimonadota bacterium]
MAEKVLLIDGHSLFHRAFHALPPLTTSEGQPTNALYGFLQMVLPLLEEQEPDYALVALDVPGPTFRDEIYEEYKGHRPPTDEALKEQAPLLEDVIEALGVQAMGVEGFEADDVIGTLARQAAAAGKQVTIVTGDKDLLQLVDDSIEVVATLRGIKETKRYDVEAVEEEYGLSPRQLTDLKALSGDSSDNIPGVPGIGDKSALTLLQQFGSLEAAIGNMDEIESTRIRNRLQEAPEAAELSKRLARLETEAPIDRELEELAWAGLHVEKLRELATRLEFTSLLERLPRGEEADLELQLQPVQSQGGLEELVAAVGEAGAMELALSQGEHAPVLAVATGDAAAALVPLAGQAEAGTLFAAADSEALDLSALAEVLADPQIAKRAADVKGLARRLAAQGVALAGMEFDPEIASYLLQPNRRNHSIELVTREHLEYALPETDGEAQAEIEPATLRAGAEAVAVRKLREPMRGLLDQAGVLDLFDDMEMPLAPVLAEMELHGIAVDTGKLEELGEQLDEMAASLEEEICEIAGCEFNVGSPQQLSEVLFERMELPKGRRTKTGWSTSAAVLEELADEFRIAELVLEYRHYAKLRSTYVDGLLAEVNPETGRVHTTFEQTVAATGRLSSRNPNLQNIPIRTEWGRKIRSCFVSEEGRRLLAADYSQIELRILAHISGEPRLVEAFRGGRDIHTETASALFEVSAEECTYEMRGRAKTVNYAVLYGQGPTALGQQLDIDRKEAEAFIENYFRALPAVRGYIDDIVAVAREQGYVETLLGRKRPLPEISSSDGRARSYAERAAVNMPIQGTAADVIKLAMIELAPRLAEESPESRMLLQVHDELVLEVPEGEVEEVAGLIEEVMESAFELNVPLVVDVSAGTNWRDMSEL